MCMCNLDLDKPTATVNMSPFSYGMTYIDRVDFVFIQFHIQSKDKVKNYAYEGNIHTTRVYLFAQ